MSDSNLNQNTSEDTSFPAAAPETNASAPAPQSAGPEEEPKQKTFTRRTVLAWPAAALPASWSAACWPRWA